MEDKVTKIDIPDADDKLTAEEARKAIVLFELDIANANLEKTKALQYAASCDAAIAGFKASIADLNRRVVGVKYPELPKKDKPNGEHTPQMGQPTGGAKKE